MPFQGLYYFVDMAVSVPSPSRTSDGNGNGMQQQAHGLQQQGQESGSPAPFAQQGRVEGSSGSAIYLALGLHLPWPQMSNGKFRAGGAGKPPPSWLRTRVIKSPKDLLTGTYKIISVSSGGRCGSNLDGVTACTSHHVDATIARLRTLSQPRCVLSFCVESWFYVRLFGGYGGGEQQAAAAEGGSRAVDPE